MRLVVVAAIIAIVGCGGGTPTQSTCPTSSTLTYDNFGRSFMTTYCYQCHSGPRPEDGVGLDTIEQIRSFLADIDVVAAAGPAAVNTEMPEQAPFPSEADRRQLGEWLACGAP